MSGLTNRALLVSLQVSQWSARRMDKEETEELAQRHGTSKENASVTKRLLASPALKAVHDKTNAVRWAYYRNSLPWGMEGVNVISTMGYLDFCKMMGEHMTDWRRLVQLFLAEYPYVRDNAQSILGTMWKEEDYPTPEVVARKFSIDCKFTPIAETGDWRVEMADDELDRLRKKTEADIAENIGIATTAAWEKVREVVEDSIKALSKPSPTFREGLIENARKMCRTMTLLNITADPALESIRSAIEGSLCKQTFDELRADPTVRGAVNDRLKDIQAKMASYYQPA